MYWSVHLGSSALTWHWLSNSSGLHWTYTHAWLSVRSYRIALAGITGATHLAPLIVLLGQKGSLRIPVMSLAESPFKNHIYGSSCLWWCNGIGSVSAAPSSIPGPGGLYATGQPKKVKKRKKKITSPIIPLTKTISHGVSRGPVGVDTMKTLGTGHGYRVEWRIGTVFAR